MITYEHDHIAEDFVNITSFKDCDLRHLSRQIIMRGIREAEFRSFTNDGRKSEQYRQTMFDLMDAQARSESWFSNNGKINLTNFSDMMRSLETAYFLVETDFQEFKSCFKAFSAGL